jgi:hypothetical protein
MIATVTERVRTRAKPTGPPPPDLPDTFDFGLSLPGYVAYAKIQEAAKAGVQMTTAAPALARGVDRPLREGQYAIMPRDEREAKYGKPLMITDIKAGRIPITAVNLGGYSIEALQEMITYQRHYRQDTLDRHEAPPDLDELARRDLERRRDRAVGRVRFAFKYKNWVE